MTRFFRFACLLTFLVAATTASGAGLDPTRLERIGAAIEAGCGLLQPPEGSV